MTDRILEIGQAGLESTDQQVRKLMDNLSNAEVPAYKKSSVLIKGFPLELDAATMKIAPVIPQVEDSYYDTTPGALIQTGGKLDIALGSEGFFVIQGSWGEGYTRDGRFRLDQDGRLLTVAGNFPVLGQNGPIVVTPGAAVEFTQDGEVKIDGVKAEIIRVVNPEQKQTLSFVTGSIFKKASPQTVLTEVDSPRVIQGYVESSNTNVVEEMMNMIVNERVYNINAKVVSTRDGNLARALDLGKPTQ